jgi:hypothetical protein
LLGESAIAVAILLVVAVLVDANPPAKPTKQPAQASAVKK